MPEAQIVETLIEEAMRIAEEMGEDVGAGEPVVNVGRNQYRTRGFGKKRAPRTSYGAEVCGWE
ncbi:hypothetical protein, partial [Nocardia cyriacigeorgica]|uniref:hypothetical protein n=1 Tax=Nocardia cyriacigeorgica TaxID=135487 RepID=UPI00245844C1